MKMQEKLEILNKMAEPLDLYVSRHGDERYKRFAIYYRCGDLIKVFTDDMNKYLANSGYSFEEAKMLLRGAKSAKKMQQELVPFRRAELTKRLETLHDGLLGANKNA